MAKRTFLAKPVWKFFRGIPEWRRRIPWRHPIMKAAYWIAGGLAFAYIAVVATAAVYIYSKHTTNTLTHFAERIYPYPAARVAGKTISLSRFRTEVAARMFYTEKHGLTVTNKETEDFVINELATRILFAKALEDRKIFVDVRAIDDELKTIYDRVGGKDKMAQFLAENYGDAVDLSLFETWLRETAPESVIEQQVLTTATVRHILVRVDENAKPEAVEAARKKAADIKAKISTPTQFAEVAKQESNDVASRDEGGLLKSTNRGSDAPVFSKDFEDAIFTMPLNTISEPIRTSYGWHLVMVDARSGSEDVSKKAFAQKLRTENSVVFYVGSK